MNNNSSTFTWILDTQYPPLNNGNPTNNTLVDSNNTTNTHPMYDGTETEEDLFNFLLQDPEKPSNKANSSSESISSGEEGYKPFTKTPDIAYSTGRLDFRQIYDNVSESQLKAMTSKERRQLRNKISARNFRNRRKEYVGTLEAELDQQKAENGRLRLEIKRLKTKMEKVQEENDKLRLDIVLGPIPQPTTFYSPDNSSPDQGWDFAFPDQNFVQENNVEPTFVDNNAFISQALVPAWDTVFIHKETEPFIPSTDLIRQYPLLAPALMSIILSHTMTMSSDQLLTSARLSPPKTNHTFSLSSSKLKPKDTKAIWDLLGPLAAANERNQRLSLVTEQKRNQIWTLTNEEEEEDEEEVEEVEEGHFCPIKWVQATIYEHLCEMMSQPMNAPLEEQTLLCRSYQKAVRYITA
ncbi:hypothetical protein G6F56_006537 [Rhizopus delemar]|nr:hypothetical protein G6F56_006537 [Rhizopus delemar]